MHPKTSWANRLRLQVLRKRGVRCGPKCFPYDMVVFADVQTGCFKANPSVAEMVLFLLLSPKVHGNAEIDSASSCKIMRHTYRKRANGGISAHHVSVKRMMEKHIQELLAFIALHLSV